MYMEIGRRLYSYRERKLAHMLTLIDVPGIIDPSLAFYRSAEGSII